MTYSRFAGCSHTVSRLDLSTLLFTKKTSVLFLTKFLSLFNIPNFRSLLCDLLPTEQSHFSYLFSCIYTFQFLFEQCREELLFVESSFFHISWFNLPLACVFLLFYQHQIFFCVENKLWRQVYSFSCRNKRNVKKTVYTANILGLLYYDWSIFQYSQQDL